MIASNFAPPPRHTFSRAARYVSYIPLYGIGVPLVRALDAAGLWTRIMAAAVARPNEAFGTYEPAASDVFVCAGFKSGTTWLLQIATQIAFRGEAEFENIHHVVPWPDGPPPFQRFMIPLADDSPLWRSPTGLRVIKSHLTLDKVPFSPVARYIAMVRDPKDVIVSGYHFLRSMIYGPLMPSVDHWIDFVLHERRAGDSWAAHLAGFWRVRDHENVLFLTYEDLKRQGRAGIERIAQFMGAALSESELASVARASSFEAMKREQARFDPGQVVPWGGSGYMLRNGRAGGSAELLTPAMQRRIDEICRAQLHELGCDFPYDEEFGGIVRSGGTWHGSDPRIRSQTS